jgi:hypothetical protein
MLVSLAPIPATVVPHKIRLLWHEISCALPEDSNCLKGVHVLNTWLKAWFSAEIRHAFLRCFLMGLIVHLSCRDWMEFHVPDRKRWWSRICVHNWVSSGGDRFLVRCSVLRYSVCDRKAGTYVFSLFRCGVKAACIILKKFTAFCDGTPYSLVAGY